MNVDFSEWLKTALWNWLVQNNNLIGCHPKNHKCLAGHEKHYNFVGQKSKCCDFFIDLIHINCNLNNTQYDANSLNTYLWYVFGTNQFYLVFYNVKVYPKWNGQSAKVGFYWISTSNLKVTYLPKWFLDAHGLLVRFSIFFSLETWKTLQ